MPFDFSGLLSFHMSGPILITSLHLVLLILFSIPRAINIQHECVTCFVNIYSSILNPSSALKLYMIIFVMTLMSDVINII